MATAATLRELIEFAYEIQPFQLIDLPKWGRDDQWDVDAKLPTPWAGAGLTGIDDTLPPLRRLLADRFQLVLRHETRPLPIYALVLARAEGRLGPQLTRASVDCAALRAARAHGDTTPLPPAAKNCGVQGRIASIQMVGSPLVDFADSLARRLQRTVVDRTGLTGTWNLTLTYTPDPTQIVSGAAPCRHSADVRSERSVDLHRRQEQLGLKLEAATGPVDVLVVERGEKAREN